MSRARKSEGVMKHLHSVEEIHKRFKIAMALAHEELGKPVKHDQRKVGELVGYIHAYEEVLAEFTANVGEYLPSKG